MWKKLFKHKIPNDGKFYRTLVYTKTGDIKRIKPTAIIHQDILTEAKKKTWQQIILLSIVLSVTAIALTSLALYLSSFQDSSSEHLTHSASSDHPFTTQSNIELSLNNPKASSSQAFSQDKELSDDYPSSSSLLPDLNGNEALLQTTLPLPSTSPPVSTSERIQDGNGSNTLSKFDKEQISPLLSHERESSLPNSEQTTSVSSLHANDAHTQASSAYKSTDDTFIASSSSGQEIPFSPSGNLKKETDASEKPLAELMLPVINEQTLSSFSVDTSPVDQLAYPSLANDPLKEISSKTAPNASTQTDTTALIDSLDPRGFDYQLLDNTIPLASFGPSSQEKNNYQENEKRSRETSEEENSVTLESPTTVMTSTHLNPLPLKNSTNTESIPTEGIDMTPEQTGIETPSSQKELSLSLAASPSHFDFTDPQRETFPQREHQNHPALTSTTGKVEELEDTRNALANVLITTPGSFDVVENLKEQYDVATNGQQTNDSTSSPSLTRLELPNPTELASTITYKDHITFHGYEPPALSSLTLDTPKTLAENSTRTKLLTPTEESVLSPLIALDIASESSPTSSHANTEFDEFFSPTEKKKKSQFTPLTTAINENPLPTPHGRTEPTTVNQFDSPSHEDLSRQPVPILTSGLSPQEESKSIESPLSTHLKGTKPSGIEEIMASSFGTTILITLDQCNANYSNCSQNSFFHSVWFYLLIALLLLALIFFIHFLFRNSSSKNVKATTYKSLFLQKLKLQWEQCKNLLNSLTRTVISVMVNSMTTPLFILFHLLGVGRKSPPRIAGKNHITPSYHST